jgi:2-polyprenyl-3-methyl-5-hydroxy-6-metoxy-1,4-benzoquinol methylase
VSQKTLPVDIDQLLDEVRKGIAHPATSPASNWQAHAGPLPTDEMLRRIRAEVARRRGEPVAMNFESASATSRHAVTDGKLERWQPAASRLTIKREYSLPELLVRSDADFIISAYRAVLKRAPDPGGFDYNLAMLRSGGMTKVEVLAAMRWSEEGEACGVHIDGLLAPFLLQKWRRIPYVGHFLGWLQGLARIGRFSERQLVLDATQARESQEVGRLLNRVADQLEHQLGTLQSQAAENAEAQRVGYLNAINAIQALHQESKLLTEKNEVVATSMRASEATARQETADALTALADRFELERAAAAAELAALAMQVEAERRTAAEQVVAAQQSLDRLATALKGNVGQVQASVDLFSDTVQADVGKLGGAIDALMQRVQWVEAESRVLAEASESHTTTFNELSRKDLAMAAEASALDPLYAAFEDKFRGDRSLVRQRAEPYLHLVRAFSAGSPDAPVLDVGCGRGEWLELLRDHGLTAKGIDLNRMFIETCRGRGLDVIDGDAIDSLKAMSDGSMGAITSMHLVEHLPFEKMISLIDEARRVLRPGGLMILETPNPENILVGSHWFYMDPTHRNPLPPETLRWLVEARGFKDVRIERLMTARETNGPALLAEEVPGASSINTMLATMNAALDYAIVAERP